MRISDWSSDVCSSDLAAARIAFAYLGERFDRLRVDIVHDALGARARRVGIGAERRESAETLEPARLRLELKLSTLGLRPRDIPLVTVEAYDRDRDPADKGDVIGFAKKTRYARDRIDRQTTRLTSH